jgi:transposase-like protein
MPALPQNLQATRAVEDRLVALGMERSQLEAKLGENLEAIVDQIPAATDAGIPFDRIAHLVGVSRQTLYRWRDVLAKRRQR